MPPSSSGRTTTCPPSSLRTGASRGLILRYRPASSTPNTKSGASRMGTGRCLPRAWLTTGHDSVLRRPPPTVIASTGASRYGSRGSVDGQKCLLSTPQPSTVPGRGLLAESRGLVDTSVEGRILFIRSVQAENKELIPFRAIDVITPPPPPPTMSIR